jgi:predicted TPR repeat methyltransferase
MNLGKPGRNEPCRCGSGKKYKNCCGGAGSHSPAGPAAPYNPAEINHLLQQGLALHQADRLAEAGEVYRRILDRAPQHPHALHLLGIVSTHTGNPSAAVELISKAIDIDSSTPYFFRSLGNALHALGRYDEEIACYDRAVDLNPGYTEAFYNKGNALQAQRRYSEAVQEYERALQLDPKYTQVHCAKGNALLADAKAELAISSYRRALSFDRCHVNSHFNLGVALHGVSNFAEAIQHFAHALDLKPDHADAANNMGNAYKEIGNNPAAEACYRKAIAIDRSHVSAFLNLANILRDRGANAEALNCFEKVLQLEPGNDLAKHLVATMRGEATDRAPDTYVERLFDNYANSFDEALLGGLNYQTPKKLALMLGAHCKLEAANFNILDLGCGTGLSGVMLAPYARTLVGVDLSANMLAKAAERNIYHRLEKAELQAMLGGESDSAYDVVLAADVFVYIGRLDGIAAEVKRVLPIGGYFAFSVEAIEQNDGDIEGEELPLYCLNSSARYAHSRRYLEELAGKFDFSLLQCRFDEIRLDKGKPIKGWLVLMQRK